MASPSAKLNSISTYSLGPSPRPTIKCSKQSLPPRELEEGAFSPLWSLKAVAAAVRLRLCCLPHPPVTWPVTVNCNPGSVAPTPHSTLLGIDSSKEPKLGPSHPHIQVLPVGEDPSTAWEVTGQQLSSGGFPWGRIERGMRNPWALLTTLPPLSPPLGPGSPT